MTDAAPPGASESPPPAAASVTGSPRGGGVSGAQLAPDDPRHGTTNGYRNLKCRCDRCREAHRVAHNAYMHRTGRTVPWADHAARVRAEAEARDNHGTETRYDLGCRCKECMAASASARAERRRRPNVARHGLRTSYANGCRCDLCREAHRVYTNSYRRRARASK